jgi:3-oxoacyl-[acyl-carrier-protein] synthase III
MSKALQRARISGVGSYLPNRIVRNDDLKEYMDTSDEWIRQRTGIEQRHWVEDWSLTTSDLALEASRKAINSAGIQKENLDMIIFATLSPDHDFPGSACFLQAKLDIPGIAVLDIRQQCSGFLYGLSIADQFIRTGMHQKILVVGAEIHSKGVDKSTTGRDVAVLFGDGAGAVVLEACQVEDSEKDSHILSTHLFGDGSYAKELWVPGPGTGFNSSERITEEMLKERQHYPRMNGKAVFMHAVRCMPEALYKAFEVNNVTVDDVDLFVFHQANIRINDMIAKQLKIPPEKIFNTIQKFGNTTAATIPLGLDEALKVGKLKKGMLVASAAFGSGFTWASSLIRW